MVWQFEVSVKHFLQLMMMQENHDFLQCFSFFGSIETHFLCVPIFWRTPRKISILKIGAEYNNCTPHLNYWRKLKLGVWGFKTWFLKVCHRPHNQLALPVSEGFSVSPPSSSFHGRHKLDISNCSRATHSAVLHYVAGFLTPVAEKHSCWYLHAGMQALE